MDCNFSHTSDRLPGEKSRGISANLMVLRWGDADPVLFFLNCFFVISGTFDSFWDIADHYNYMHFC